MKIKWIGHASFLITDSFGKKIVIDPFDASVGYELYEGDADIVTLSHHHHDHDYTELIKGNPTIIDQAGSYNEQGINFVGIPSYHDKQQGAKRGKNVIFVYTIDGYKVCHLGDLGYELSDDEIKNIGDIDVLMIPVGGVYTIDAQEAAKLALRINGRYIIPMHYKTDDLKIGLSGVDEFINAIGIEPEYENSNFINITGKFDFNNKLIILNYK